jgi:hypothetical protein
VEQATVSGDFILGLRIGQEPVLDALFQLAEVVASLAFAVEIRG